MRYKPDRVGVGRLLKQDQMGEVVHAYAEAGARFAAHIGPIDSGEYRESFDTAVQVAGDRQTAILFNTADHAAAVEWGTHNQQGYHVLSRTIDWIEGAE